MLSENLRMQARRVLKSALRAHIYREKLRQDPTYEKWCFLADLEETTTQEWYETLENEKADEQLVIRYVLEALPECLETIMTSFGDIGVSVEAEMVSFMTVFEPLDLMPKRILH